MDLTMTLSNADNSIIEAIKEFIRKLPPKVSVSVNQLYPVETATESAQKSAEEVAFEERRAKVEALCGALSQYANPKLQKKEKDAWAMAMREKYGVR